MSIVLSTDVAAALRDRDAAEAAEAAVVDEVVCVECGCSDSNPCVDSEFRPCGWIWRDERSKLGLCTFCGGL